MNAYVMEMQKYVDGNVTNVKTFTIVCLLVRK